MLVENNYKEYLDVLSSNSPSPGGGSVSSISAGLAVSLLQMVCSVSMDKKGLEEYSQYFRDLYKQAEEYKEAFIRGVDDDSEAFSMVIKAFRMPKETEQEKSLRSKAIQDGYKHAASVPFNIGKKAYEFLPIIEAAVEDSNKTAITDLYVSAVQLIAAIDGVFVNVKINLTSIKDQYFVDEYNAKMDEMLEDAKKRTDLIKERVMELF